LPADETGADREAAEQRANQPPELGAAAATAERIARLIAQLGDDDYFVRERAQQELAQIGFEAYDALSAAEDHDDVEVAARAKYLVRTMRVDWTADGDPPPVKTQLSNYPTANEAAAGELIKKLAALPDDIGLSALCRIVRFERSTLLSKQAAVAVLDQKSDKGKSDEGAWPRREADDRARHRFEQPGGRRMVEDLPGFPHRGGGGHRRLASTGRSRGKDPCRNAAANQPSNRRGALAKAGGAVAAARSPQRGRGGHAADRRSGAGRSRHAQRAGGLVWSSSKLGT